MTFSRAKTEEASTAVRFVFRPLTAERWPNLERLFGPRVHKAMNTMQSELAKVRSGGKSELLDTLIVYRWHTLFEPFSRDPVEVGGPKATGKR